MIKGWDEGVAQLSTGERAKLTISPDYGYGARGAAGVRIMIWISEETACVLIHLSLSYNVDLLQYSQSQHEQHFIDSFVAAQVIPPNATLIFDVELLSFK